MSFFIQGTTRPDRRYEHRFMSWFLSVRTAKSFGSYHNSIGSYCEIYRFVSQFDQAVLWNWNLSVRITFLSGRTVKSIGSYHNLIGPYCEIYRFVSQFYRAVLWNLSVRITILLGRTVKSIGSYHISIGSYCEIYQFVSQLYQFVSSFCHILDRSDRQSSLWLPTESNNVQKCWSPSWKGPYRFVS
jgi:hypothetical protein